MPVAIDLVRIVVTVLPVAGVLVLLAGVAVLALALRRRGRSRTLFAAMGGATLLLAGLLLLGMAWLTSGLRQSYTAAGSALPPLAYTVVAGPADAGAARLSDLVGSVVLVNAWATWCGPCIQEMPALAEVQRELGPRGLRIVAVSDEPAMTVEAWAAHRGLPFLIARVDPAEALGAPYASMFTARPTTLVVDRAGVVRRILVGAQTRDALRAAVEPLL